MEALSFGYLRRHAQGLLQKLNLNGESKQAKADRRAQDEADKRLIQNLIALCKYLLSGYPMVIKSRDLTTPKLTSLLHRQHILQEALKQNRRQWLNVLHEKAPGNSLLEVLIKPASRYRDNTQNKIEFLGRLCEKHKLINIKLREIQHMSAIEKQKAIVEKAYPTELLEVMGVPKGVIGPAAWKFLNKDGTLKVDIMSIETWVYYELWWEDEAVRQAALKAGKAVAKEKPAPRPAKRRSAPSTHRSFSLSSRDSSVGSRGTGRGRGQRGEQLRQSSQEFDYDDGEWSFHSTVPGCKILVVAGPVDIIETIDMDETDFYTLLWLEDGAGDIRTGNEGSGTMQQRMNQ